MTKTLAMVSHKNYNLSANEGFVMFLTSKFVTCFIDGFTLKRKSSQLLIYSMEVNFYIGFWTLKMKCTQYGLYTSGLQECKGNFIFHSRAPMLEARLVTGRGVSPRLGRPGSGHAKIRAS